MSKELNADYEIGSEMRIAGPLWDRPRAASLCRLRRTLPPSIHRKSPPRPTPRPRCVTPEAKITTGRARRNAKGGHIHAVYEDEEAIHLVLDLCSRSGSPSIGSSASARDAETGGRRRS
ncbi:uncharacterized protein A4U43_C04F650 [Asparagus officinalis]|uniref:Uncharacterized protein n=1 Tax=Asparagus officinalis TaxID=4686 RepID=A0A5P1EZ12_ASPOF|nr:uncharacterized protein A4U43_C04F650 [Asparagus officinalis]